MIKEHIGQRILEIGAGIGSNMSYYISNKTKSITLIEPDKMLCTDLKNEYANNHSKLNIRVINGCISSINSSEHKFDSILYIDVLEHIEKDKEELLNASKFLDKDGCIVILAPAHNYLYSTFDQAVGHFRRYNKQMLLLAAPSTLTLDKVSYIDSVGLLLSLANKLILKKAIPNHRQIRFWDSKIIPISKKIDRIINYSFGKTIIGIYKKLPTEIKQ
ncbi:tRNA (mo5U34)-methyltransferase [Synechococcus sp. MIT S9508]|nr:tRNA (mo5U34)-methyltransferase [Synechococcus sp. MIT S9508]